jgi:uncharacterized secreted protein with C-terminal beta-propeller domain
VLTVGENQMNQFSSYEELAGFLKPESSDYPDSPWQNGNLGGGIVYDDNFGGGGFQMFGQGTSDMMLSMAESDGARGASMSGGPSLVPKSSTDFSGTNNQVKGVDEADIIKTDGEYVYYTAGTSIYIVKAYPADSATLVSEIELESIPQQIFINGNKLVVFEYGYYYYGMYKRSSEAYVPNLSLKIYDISDKANPVMAREVSSDDNYVSSRMIGNYVYMIINSWVFDQAGQINLPEIHIDEDVIEVAANEVYYPNTTDNNYGFTTVVAVNIQNDDVEPSYATMVLGSAGVVYVSTGSVYITVQEYTDGGEVTQIHRFSVNDEHITYTACGAVPGYLLNQFSMDEYNGYFRVVTTSNSFTAGQRRSTTMNNLYVLNTDMDVVGKVEDLAPGERIYSARFMGNRGYMVTFRQVDPLFAIDLSDPTDPQVLGELKITGYSDYLHPYDENHLIGIGKEATEEGFFQGMKIALFDVSDISNPTQIDVYEIGDRGTESPVLNDHKAFLFDKELNMMVMPVLIAEHDENGPSRWRGDYVWQGAMVFDISPETGIVLRGGITHDEDEFASDDDWYYVNSLNEIKRSLYIEDVLYTVSDGLVKMNDLETLDYINEVELWDGEGLNRNGYPERMPGIMFMD